MIAIGILYALMFWLLYSIMLIQFEVHIMVLHPRTRRVYSVSAFITGILLAFLVARSN
jgi:hypothetical protein